MCDLVALTILALQPMHAPLAPRPAVCRCVEPASVRAAYQAAHAVVVARVVEVRSGADRLAAVLTVSEAWKRGVPKRVTVVSATTCRYDLVPNEEYVLYLLHDPKMLGGAADESYTTGICLGNKRLADAGETVRWLRQHARPGVVEGQP